MVRHSPTRKPSKVIDEMATRSIAIIKKKNTDTKTRITKFSNYLESKKGYVEEIHCKLEGLAESFANFKNVFEEQMYQIEDETTVKVLTEESLNIEDRYYKVRAAAKKNG